VLNYQRVTCELDAARQQRDERLPGKPRYCGLVTIALLSGQRFDGGFAATTGMLPLAGRAGIVAAQVKQCRRGNRISE